jgi:hypothetical protein
MFAQILNDTHEKKTELERKITTMKENAHNLIMDLQMDNCKIGTNDTNLVNQYKYYKALIEYLNIEVKERLSAHRKRLIVEQKLCFMLDEEPLIFKNKIPTSQDEQEHQAHIERLLKKCKKNIIEIRELNKVIAEKKQLMDIADNICNVSASKSYSDSHIKSLKETIAKLDELYVDMKTKLGDIKQKLYSLWSLMKIPKSYQSNFEKFAQVTEKNYDILLKELNKCESMKSIWEKNLCLREEIVKYQKLCLMTSDEEKDELEIDCSEEMCIRLQGELKYLKAYHEENGKIIEKLQQRDALRDEIDADKENQTGNVEKFKNRGGTLFKELKEKELRNKRLLKFEAELVKLVTEYKKKNQKEFLVYGNPIELNYTAKRHLVMHKATSNQELKLRRIPLKERTNTNSNLID